LNKNKPTRFIENNLAKNVQTSRFVRTYLQNRFFLLQLDNINLCLGVLKAQHVSGLENVSAQELRDGKLKAILALFFALSRHKQAAKQRAQHIQQNQLADMTPNR
jgi:hypothetical protein